MRRVTDDGKRICLSLKSVKKPKEYSLAERQDIVGHDSIVLSTIFITKLRNDVTMTPPSKNNPDSFADSSVCLGM